METEEKVMTVEESLKISIWVISFIAFFGGYNVALFAVPVAMLTGYLIPDQK